MCVEIDEHGGGGDRGATARERTSEGAGRLLRDDAVPRPSFYRGETRRRAATRSSAPGRQWWPRFSVTGRTGLGRDRLNERWWSEGRGGAWSSWQAGGRARSGGGLIPFPPSL